MFNPNILKTETIFLNYDLNKGKINTQNIGTSVLQLKTGELFNEQKSNIGNYGISLTIFDTKNRTQSNASYTINYFLKNGSLSLFGTATTAKDNYGNYIPNDYTEILPIIGGTNQFRKGGTVTIVYRGTKRYAKIVYIK